MFWLFSLLVFHVMCGTQPKRGGIFGDDEHSTIIVITIRDNTFVMKLIVMPK